METYGLYAVVGLSILAAVYVCYMVVTKQWRWPSRKRQTPAEQKRAKIAKDVDRAIGGRSVGSDFEVIMPGRNGQVETSDEEIEESAQSVLRRMKNS